MSAPKTGKSNGTTDPSKGYASVGGPVSSTVPNPAPAVAPTTFDSGKRNSASGSVPGHPTTPVQAPDTAMPGPSGAPAPSSIGAGPAGPGSGSYQGAPTITAPIRGQAQANPFFHPTGAAAPATSHLGRLNAGAAMLGANAPGIFGEVRTAVEGIRSTVQADVAAGHMDQIGPHVRAGIEGIRSAVRGGGTAHTQPVPSQPGGTANRQARVAARIARRAARGTAT